MIYHFKINNIKLISENRRLMLSKSGYFSNKEYKKEKNYLISCFKSQFNGETIKEQFAIKIKIKTKKAKDLTNLFKPLLDALQEAGVISNDNLCVRLYGVKTIIYHKDPEEVEIWIASLTGNTKDLEFTKNSLS